MLPNILSYAFFIPDWIERIETLGEEEDWVELTYVVAVICRKLLIYEYIPDRWNADVQYQISDDGADFLSQDVHVTPDSEHHGKKLRAEHGDPREVFLEVYADYIELLKQSLEELAESLKEPAHQMWLMLTSYTGEKDQDSFIVGDPFEGASDLVPFLQIIYTTLLLMFESHPVELPNSVPASVRKRLKSSVYENPSYPIRFPNL